MPDQKLPEPSGSLLIDNAILEANTHIDEAFQEFETTFLADEAAIAMAVMQLIDEDSI
ncbi:MAG: hypothetical protein QF704_00015 [Anaerolineales bacterium]|jgi:hypothetical protein|nr:hypothetical protein [Anaerolineales bacterium]